jgi:hypothetical protein
MRGMTDFDVERSCKEHLADLSLHAASDKNGNIFFTGAEGLPFSTDLLTGRAYSA